MSQSTSSARETTEAQSFLSLLEIHGHLNDLFHRHQEAVLLLDVEAARTTLDEYEHELREHIRFEEEALFPIYERALPIEGGGLNLYRSEHQKLLRYVNGIRKSLDTVKPKEDGGLARIIDLLDFETKLKGLLMHHDLRERNIFYPALDRVASPSEAAALLASGPHGA